MRVHLDHNATSNLLPEVQLLLRELDDERAAGHLGNPSSLHASGRRARQLIDEARERTAAALGLREDQVVFNSGGTESNATAIFGTLVRERSWRGLAVSAVEHSAVLEPGRAARAAGRPLTVLPVDDVGRVDLDEVERVARDPRTALVSVMAANNEIGTLQPLGAISALLHARGPRRPTFHTDAVQTPGKCAVTPAEWGADLASFSAHKAGGPVGVGVLAVLNESRAPEALLRGGEQEQGRRAGTENAVGIAAAALAFELSVEREIRERTHQRQRLETFWNRLRADLPQLRLNGPSIERVDRLPNTLNVHLPGTDGRVLVTRLDLEGIEVSAGSACASGAVEPSPVLRALGRTEEEARAGLRLSFSATISDQELLHAAETITRTLRALHA